jgi:septal ring factor EnvC (AmiA/AmiB activator)
VEKPKEFNRLLRYLTSIERAYYRVLDKLTKLQKERRAEEQAAAFEKAWVEQVKSEQQPTEIKKPANELASFCKFDNLPQAPENQPRQDRCAAANFCS